ncbi:ABC transporter substrate-binding protein [Brevibacillus fortis]|uniref:ABC transporter substrate-binding protein n=1 Tax=Brevibacillus fortis TaxID=2126352 RepID=A0A2P7UT93_9BACL|nr:iron-siderophore ABC transporter substrate-binding protein [Brevibacillus fortis]PSJ90196.1 ABC transporter substrate-binding protein [Brevibacillus fortis]
MRKTSLRLMLGAMLSVVMLVTGCGGQATPSSSSSSSTPAASSTTPAPTPAATEEREVKHFMGSTKIKGTPQRVVALTSESTEAVLALGITPVGAVMSGLGKPGDPWHPHIKEKMKDAVELGDENQPNVELIASLKPDLILGTKGRQGQEKVYAQLSAIAPTVFSEDLVGRWKINFALYSEALNKKAEGDKLMADFDKKIEDAKGKLGDKTKTKVSVVRFVAGRTRLYLKDTFSGVVLSQLGFARPASQDIDEFKKDIPKELMAEMDGDVMFYWIGDYSGDGSANKYTEEWMKDPLYQKLNVAKNNKAFQVDEVIWNVGGGILSAELLVDDIVERFSKL